MVGFIKIEKAEARNALAPCPFCGNAQPVYAQYERHAAQLRWMVFCSGCCASVDPGYAQSKYQVQALWNRRA